MLFRIPVFQSVCGYSMPVVLMPVLCNHFASVYLSFNAYEIIEKSFPVCGTSNIRTILGTRRQTNTVPLNNKNII